ncbi:EAL domain-containing protein [Salinisphaera sp. C84B14]|uniref:sensor domain-containing protein n=1 Tax=Salinisphaera sp. C84B14 TaxID=1304155 RepID=UPI003341F293
MTDNNNPQPADLGHLVALVSDFYWRCDQAGRFVALQGAAVERGDIDVQAWQGRLPAEVGLGVVDRAGWPLPEQAVADASVSWIRADGSIRHLSIAAQCERDENGVVRGWQGLARDVTRQHRGYRELEQLRTAIDASHDMIFVVDRETMRFLYVNDIACELTGHPRETFMASTPDQMLGVDRGMLEAEYDRVIAVGRLTVEDRSRLGRGGSMIVERRRCALFVEGRWVIVSIVHDITDRKLAEQARDRLSRMYATLSATNEALLRADTPEELYQQVCEAAVANDDVVIAAVLRVDAEKQALCVVGAASSISADVRELIIPLDPHSRLGDGLVARCYHSARTQVADDYVHDGRLLPWRRFGRRMGLKSAAAVPVIKAGTTIGVMLFVATHKGAYGRDGVRLIERMVANVVFALENLEREAWRRESEKHIEFLATHDALTRLPNRTLFNQSLTMAIAAEHRFAVLFIDLDRFKFINDSLGHEAGDQLLQTVASRLRACTSPTNMVARLGGDEFVVLIEQDERAGALEAVADTILDTILQPVCLNGHDYRVTASVGISIYPQDARDASSLLKQADMAMYCAKDEGKNNYQFYAAELEHRSLVRMRLENNLRCALEKDQFELAYQAKISLADSRIVGVEALLRWHCEELGTVMPGQFLPLAEELGLIVPIGRWVLETACEQNMAWQRAGLPPVPIAVNISAVQLSDQTLVSHVRAVLERTGMAPNLLELEITETAVMRDIARALALLAEMKKLGVMIAIDDFGTGYSSLTQLRELPVDTLKIDRSFVSELATNRTDQSIARAIITMGKNLSLNVIAEGVETAEQEAFLRAEACDSMQGFYFSRPTAATLFAELLGASTTAQTSASARMQAQPAVEGAKRVRSG